MYTQEAAVCHFDNDHKSKYINCLREIHYFFCWSLHDMFELMATRVYCHTFLSGIQHNLKQQQQQQQQQKQQFKNNYVIPKWFPENFGTLAGKKI